MSDNRPTPEPDPTPSPDVPDDPLPSQARPEWITQLEKSEQEAARTRE